MAEENVITSPEATATATFDSHKRKLAEADANSDPEPVNNAVQGEENGGADESETKRQRLESNGDDVTPADGLVLQNGQNEKKEDEPEEEEPEQPQSSAEVQEPTKEPVETITEEPASNENEKPETEIADEPGQPKREAEEPSEEPPSNENEKPDTGIADERGQPKTEVEEPSEELPRDGDVPVPSDENQLGSDAQILSRKMEVPNDKVGVLIGKAGDTIRSLQDNSGAKIQIVKDADADPRAPTRPLELVGTLQNINKAEKLIKDVIAEADAGGSPSLVARGFNTVQAASGGEQIEIQVPIEKVGLIIGKGGETIRNLQTRSGARIQLIQQNASDGDQSRERIVRVTGNKKQIDTAREMIKDVMNQTVRPSPLSSGGYNQQSFRPRGPVTPQWGQRGPQHAQFSGYDYPPQRGSYPSQNSQYPPPTYGNYPPTQPLRSNFGPNWEQRPPASMHGPSPQGNYNYGQQQQQGPDYGHPPPPYSQTPAPQPYGHHGYNNEVKYDHHHHHHPSSQQMGGTQPTPYGPHSGYGCPPQDQYGKPPPPMYGMQQVPPHSQQQQPPYSGLPIRPTNQPQPQPGEVPNYQAPPPVSSYGQNVPPPQQTYPYPSTGPTPQSYPPPYGSAPPTTDGYGHTPQSGQPVAGYSQPGAQQPYPQAGGYGSYPTYAEQQQQQPAGYQQGGPADPAAASYGGAQGQAGNYAQPSHHQTQHPTYDQSGGSYANVPPPPVPAAYQQYDSTQMYTGHR